MTLSNWEAEIKIELELIEERCERIPGLAQTFAAAPRDDEDTYDALRNISGALHLILVALP